MRLLPCLLLAGLCIAKPQAMQGADETKTRQDPGSAADVQDVIFLGKSRPVMIRLHLLIDGKPYSLAWDAYVQKLFAFADRNNDGFLDGEEIKRLPPAQMMQQLVRGNFYNFYNMPSLNIAQLDTNSDSKVDLAEVKAYYAEKAQTAALQLAPGYSQFGGLPGGNSVTDALLKYLGAKDGKLDLSKLTPAHADTLMSKLDSNDDETVDVAELTAGMPQGVFGRGQPGGVGMMPAMGRPGAIAMGESSFLLVPKEKGAGQLTERLVLSKELVKRYDKDESGKLTREEIGLDAESFKLLDRNGDGVLDPIELLRYFVVSPDVEMTAYLGKREVGQPAIQLTPGSKSMLASKIQHASIETLMLGLSTLQMELRAGDNTGVYIQPAAQRLQYFMQIFNLADKGKKGFIDVKEDVKAPNVQYMKALFEMSDRDGDGKVTKKEFEETMALHSEAFGTTSTVTVSETNKGLFELLDVNRDGRLSVRELRKAKERLAEYDLNGDGILSDTEIPIQVTMVIGRGSQPAQQVRQQFNPGFNPVQRTSTTAGPMWFRKMDRNGDGDVSRREFLGSPEDFKKLDLDGDGFISREEAEKADLLLRAKQTRKD